MKNLVISFLTVFALLLVSCEKEDLDKNDVKTGVIGHFGFDFSSGLTGMDDGAMPDGEVIGWNPMGTGGTQGAMYWRADQHGLNNEQVDMGAVDLSNVKTVPSAWDNPINALQVGHSYVVKCHDGYAAFKVLSVKDADRWDLEVEYIFTTETDF